MEGRKDILWPAVGVFHLHYDDKYASGVQPCFLWLLLCGWKLNRCRVTMYTHCDSGKTISWSSCTDQCLLVTGAELSPALGAVWTPPQQDVTMPEIILVGCTSLSYGWWGGSSQEQKGSCGWQSSFLRVSVWYKLLTAMLWGLWAASCSREGSSQGWWPGPCPLWWMGRAPL